jgi:hypothetical protein
MMLRQMSKKEKMEHQRRLAAAYDILLKSARCQEEEKSD